MQPKVGEIYEGKVTGVTKFGAFVALEGGQTGLVHISEITNTYVVDVHDHVSDGQSVKVKVLSLGDNGKINLSIKKAMAPEPAAQQAYQSKPRQYVKKPAAPVGEPTFEDKLKQFMQDSDSRMSGNRLYSDKKGGRGRRRD